MIKNKMSFERQKNGFTLIELMIVVAIIGILAAVAIPKFAEMTRIAKEAATKGELAALRSAIATYYADHAGIYPTAMDWTDPDNSLVDMGYLDKIPIVKLGTYHNESSNVDSNIIDDDGEWNYINSTGEIFVDCSHNDTKGSVISSW